jgi:hypothetical protein
MGRAALARTARSLATQAAAVFHALRSGQTLPERLSFEVSGTTYTTRKPTQLTARYGNLLRRRAGIYAAKEARRDALVVAAWQRNDTADANRLLETAPPRLIEVPHHWQIGVALRQVELGYLVDQLDRCMALWRCLGIKDRAGRTGVEDARFWLSSRRRPIALCKRPMTGRCSVSDCALSRR